VQRFRTVMILWDKSEEDFALASPVTAYVTGSALTRLRDAVAYMGQEGCPRWGGPVVHDAASVLSDTKAVVITCDDASKLEEVGQVTGAVDPASSAPADQQYLLETWQLVRLGGEWAVSALPLVTLSDPRRPLRRLLRRRGLPRPLPLRRRRLSGYWASGRTEDMFRSEKRQPIGQI
jgi:hypothetical protein